MATDWEALFALLDSEWLIDLRKRADNEVLMRSDLETIALPEGVERDAAWHVLTAIRHQTAQILPFETYLDIGYSTEPWYTLTRSLAQGIKAIESRCSAGSALDGALPTLRSTYPFMRLLEEELAHALTMQGFDVEPACIHAAFTGADAGGTGVGRIARNFHDLVFDLGRFDRRAIAPSLIEELYWQLVEGAEDVAFPAQTRRPFRPLAGSRYYDPAESMRAICFFATAEDEALYHPVVRLSCIYWVMSDFDVTPQLTCVVEVALRHLLTRRWGCPALGWVPLVGNEHAIGADVFFDSHQDCGYGLDCTYLLQRIVDYQLAGSDRLLQAKDEYDLLSAHVEEHLAGRMNPRQRAIVLNALQAPDTPLRIEPHRQHFGVAYPTARSDFLQLVRLGYLEQRTEGRAFVFLPAPTLLDAAQEW